MASDLYTYPLAVSNSFSLVRGNIHGLFVSTTLRERDVLNLRIGAYELCLAVLAGVLSQVRVGRRPCAALLPLDPLHGACFLVLLRDL